MARWNDPEAFREKAPPSPNPYFYDVPASRTAEFPYVQKLYELGITAGCAVGYFCPDNATPSWQAATFAVPTRRRIENPSCPDTACLDNFTYNANAYFQDVSSANPYFKWIQRLRELGGASEFEPAGYCYNYAYCPDANITRGEKAVYIIRAVLGDWNN